MKSKHLFAALLVWSTLQVAGCSREIATSDVDSEIKWLVNQTVLANATLDRAPQVSRTKAAVEADWQIATSLTSQEYLDALKRSLGSEYRVTHQSAAELDMSRLLPGDVYEVHVTNSGRVDQHIRLNVHFIATPD